MLPQLGFLRLSSCTHRCPPAGTNSCSRPPPLNAPQCSSCTQAPRQRQLEARIVPELSALHLPHERLLRSSGIPMGWQPRSCTAGPSRAARPAALSHLPWPCDLRLQCPGTCRCPVVPPSRSGECLAGLPRTGPQLPRCAFLVHGRGPCFMSLCISHGLRRLASMAGIQPRMLLQD